MLQPFSSSGMLIWVCPQPNHQFGMEFICGYLSLEPLTYCWARLKQASGFPSYSCLLPGWGFQSAGAPGTHSSSLRVPMKPSWMTQGVGVKSPGCWQGSQGGSCGLVPSGALGFCRIQMMGKRCVPAKGPVSAWVTLSNLPNPRAAVEMQRGKDVSKGCSVNLISARLKDSWSEETCLLWGLRKQFLCKLRLFFFFFQVMGSIENSEL